MSDCIMPSDPEQIAAAFEQIQAGGLVAFPTETVYGVGADVWNAAAVERIYAIKNRPTDKPLIVHVSSIDMAQRVCQTWPDTATRLAKCFWPGPLTLILERNERLPGAVTSHGPTVGVRMPDHPLTLALIEMLDTPLAGTSANRSGELSPTHPAHVRASFEDASLFILDGGRCVGGIESTVVDLSGDQLRILRPGPITPRDIAKVLGQSAKEVQIIPSDHDRLSPGITIEYISLEQAIEDCLSLGHQTESTRTDRLVLLCQSTAIPAALAGAQSVVRMPDDPEHFSQQFYSTLRNAIAHNIPTIAIVPPWDPTNQSPPEDAWQAIAHRIERLSKTV